MEAQDRHHDNDHITRAVQEQAEAQLKALFQELPNRIDLVLVTDARSDEPYGRAAREVIQAVSRISDKVALREISLESDQAKEWNVAQAPTMIFCPDKYDIRWSGAPVGEEGRTLVEALLMLGLGKSGLSDQSRKVLAGIEDDRRVKVFVSPTCPYCPQQAVNAIKAAIEAPYKISVEIIDIQVNPQLARKYNAASVPTVYANEIMVAQGAQPEELFVASLAALEQQAVFIPDNDAEEIEADVVIVGGGPAGLTAGIYSARNGFKTVVVEKDALGGQMATTPVVENYPGLTQVGGKSLVDIMVNHALQYVTIFPHEEVVDIKPGQPIVVTTTRRRFLARAVVLAVGAAQRKLGAPGEDSLAGLGVSYCATCDGPLFKGRKAAVIGGGDSAVTEALHLHHIGVQVTLIHRRDKLRAQQRLQDSLKNEGVEVVYDSEVDRILGTDRVTGLDLRNNRTGLVSRLKLDGVFVSIGYRPNVDLARGIGVELTEDGYIKKDARHRTNVPGIYSAGDVEGGYKQIVIAAGQGSEAAMALFEDLINPYWTNDHRNRLLKDDEPA